MTWALNLLKRFPPHFNSYLVKLVTFDIIRILLIFWDNVTTQLLRGGENWQVYVQIIPDHKSEKVTKIGARLTKLSPKQFSLSIYGMYVT